MHFLCQSTFFISFLLTTTMLTGQWVKHVIPSDGLRFYADGGSVIYTYQTSDFPGGSSTDGIFWSLCPILDASQINFTGIIGAHHDTIITYTKTSLTSTTIRASFDTGVAWTTHMNSNSISFIERTSFINGRICIFTTDGYNMYSDDYGITWLPIAGLPLAKCSEIARQGTTLFCSVGKELFLSTNGGALWEPIPVPQTSILGHYTARVFASAGMLFLGYDFGIDQATVWFSSPNIGSSWIDRPEFPTKSCWSFFSMSSGNLFLTDRYGETYRSIDNGTTWMLLSSQMHQMTRNIIYNSRQLVSFDDGITFQAGGFGLQNQYDTGAFGVADNFYLTGNGSHFRKSDSPSGINWQPSPLYCYPTQGPVCSDKETVAQVYYHTGAVAFSTDAGLTFQFGDSLVPAKSEVKAIMENVLYISDSNGENVWISTDFGASLQLINPLPGNNYYWLGAIENAVYLIANGTRFYKADRNAPTVFNELTVSFPQVNAAALKTVGNQLYFYSIDDDKTYRFDGLQIAECPTIRPMLLGLTTKADSGNELYLIGNQNSQIYRSIDAGNTWAIMSPPPQFPSSNAYYTMAETNGYLWLFVNEYSTRVNHLYSWPLENVSIKDPQIAGTNFSLSPNPTNGQCIISFDLPINQPCTVQIFDALGKAVMSQQYDQLPQQFALPQWSATSGVYLVQVQTRMGTVVRKLVVD